MAMRARTHGGRWRRCGCSPQKPSNNIRGINLNCEVVFPALFFPVLFFPVLFFPVLYFAAAGRRLVMVHGF